MTYAIIAYVFSAVLWVVYLAWVRARLKRVSGTRPEEHR
jgi:hypothetical protein